MTRFGRYSLRPVGVDCKEYRDDQVLTTQHLGQKQQRIANSSFVQKPVSINSWAVHKKLLRSNGSEDREALLFDWLFGLNLPQLFNDFAFIIGELCWDLDPDVDLHNQCM